MNYKINYVYKGVEYVMIIKKIIIVLLCVFTIITLGAFIASNKVSVTKTHSSDRNFIGQYESSYIRNLLGLKDGQDIDYAGRFIDTNGDNIRLVYKSAKNITQNELKKRIKIASVVGGIHFMDAKYSLKKLQDINEVLIKNMMKLAPLGLISFGIDEKRNRIEVDIKIKNKGVKEKIYKLVDKSAIIFNETNLTIQFTYQN